MSSKSADEIAGEDYRDTWANYDDFDVVKAFIAGRESMRKDMRPLLKWVEKLRTGLCDMHDELSAIYPKEEPK